MAHADPSHMHAVMSWSDEAWRHPTAPHWHPLGIRDHKASSVGYGPCQTRHLVEDGVAGRRPPGVRLGSLASTYHISHNNNPGTKTILGGTVTHVLPQSERVKLVTRMMMDAQQLRVAALSWDELDAVIFAATGQQASMCPVLN